MSDQDRGPVGWVPGGFRIDAVLGRSFSILLRNFAPFLLLAIVFTFPYHIPVFFPDMFAGDDVWGAFALTFSTALIGMSLLTATIVYGTIVQMRGGHANMTECIVKGLGLMLPVIAVSLVTGIIVGAGAMLLLAPGVFMYVVLWVAVPAAVVERTGVIASLRRSAELTKGFRWQVLAVVLILVAISLVVQAVSAIPVSIIASFTDPNSYAVAGVVSLVVQAASAALTSVAVAVGYHDLRIAKEGGNTNQIAAVFD
jgi:hypothetical protein